MPNGHNNDDPNVALFGFMGDQIFFQFKSQFNSLIGDNTKIQEVLIEFDSGYPGVITEFEANVDFEL